MTRSLASQALETLGCAVVKLTQRRRGRQFTEIGLAIDAQISQRSNQEAHQ